MPTIEDILDDVTLQASEIVAREQQNDIVKDLYDVIAQKCSNGEAINELNGIERTFYLCQSFEAEIREGGLEQFYKSFSGNYANETVEALLEVQAQKRALILDKGNAVFKEGIVPEDLPTRLEELQNLDEVDISWLFDEWNKELRNINEDLEALCLCYVLSNKEAFM